MKNAMSLKAKMKNMTKESICSIAFTKRRMP